MEELAVQYVLSADQQNNNVFSFILIDNLKKLGEKYRYYNRLHVRQT